MHWPQYTVIALMTLGGLRTLVVAARNPRITSLQAALAAAFTLGMVAAYAYILHAGGFW